MHDMIRDVGGAPDQDRRALRGHRLRDRRHVDDQGREEPGQRRKSSSTSRSRQEAQDIGVKLKIHSIPSNKDGRASPAATRSSPTIKLIDYDSAKYGSSAERRRLLAKWAREVKACRSDGTTSAI